ncbi:flagellar hook capping FlgD N-terminal domain-containing protein [Ferviditalea candida]|uniref:Flagellar hook capping FlgD N-terminal domain-containing protein n=1 Tax=Ferviditalea candida TaxID=3108399 RepID=A0ABU5ZJ92_9BACL|nr:flagellar hook capping FlgD N-terminal domain-containing protein [Paenibacillaceae bacterium T2]
MASSVQGTAVWPSYSQSNNSTVTTKNGNSLGKDDFLRILVEQLKNQDPMQPLQDKDFIAQMAQFTSVEQITNMASDMKLLRQSLGFASGLIGKSVSWTTGSGTSVQVASGLVDAIIVKDGQQYAQVKGEEIPLDQIVKISG